MQITYHHGKEMMLAGWSIETPKQEKEMLHLDLNIDFDQFSLNKLNQISQATNADEILSELRGLIPQDWPSSLKETNKNMQPY